MPRGRKKKAPRRKPGTGAIRYKAGRDKPYQATLTLGSGLSRHKSFVDADQAAQWLDQLVEERDRLQRDVTGGSQSVTVFLIAWLKLREPLISPNTFRSYTQFSRHATLHLGGKRVDEVTREDVQMMLNAMQTQKKPYKAIGQFRVFLRRVFEYAVQERYIDRNPCVYTEVRTPDAREVPVVTKEQRAAMLKEAITEDRLRQEYETVRLCPIWHLLSVLGLRRGEALGLQWTDLDEINRTLTIQRQITTDRGRPDERKPKTKKAIRTIPLPDDIYHLLQTHRKTSASHYMFARADGTPLKPTYLQSRWWRLRKRCDIPQNLTIHDLRHVSAYLLAISGVDDVIRMAILGHSGKDMATHYAGHASLDDMRQALNKAS